MAPRWKTVRTLIKYVTLLLMLPLTAIAAILFYAGGNPMFRETGASISYLLLFIVRNIVTLGIGRVTSVFVIDYLSIRKRLIVKLAGRMLALLIVQSRGWPSLIFFWGFWSIVMTCGYIPFVKHCKYKNTVVNQRPS